MRERDRRRRLREVVRAGEIVDGLLTGYHIADEVRSHRVVVDWRIIVGARIAARTRPHPVRDGVLHVQVSNSTWMHQLAFMREEIKTRVNEHVGAPPLVSSVRLHLGYRRRDDGAEPVIGPARRTRRRRPLPPPASDEQLAEIERELAAVDDPELQAVILEARRRLAR